MPSGRPVFNVWLKAWRSVVFSLSTFHCTIVGWSPTTQIKQWERNVVFRWAGVCGEGRNTSSPKNACVGGYAFPGSNAINSYVYCVELSVLSLVIHKSRALFSKPFQSQANCKLFHVKSLLISSQSECFLTVRFIFEYAILLILLARPSYFKQRLIFQ